MMNPIQCTGITRKVDNLGRLVIPKEIRTQLHIEENDPINIFILKGQINPVTELKDDMILLARDKSALSTLRLLSAVEDQMGYDYGTDDDSGELREMLQSYLHDMRDAVKEYQKKEESKYLTPSQMSE